MKEKPAIGFPFFGAFSSDRIHMATKDVNVRLFIHSFTFRDELMIKPENSGNFFEATTYFTIFQTTV